MTLTEEIMKYLIEDIAENGGTGRRLSKIQWELEHYVEDNIFYRAVQELVDSGLAHIEEIPDLNYVYLVPNP